MITYGYKNPDSVNRSPERRPAIESSGGYSTSATYRITSIYYSIDVSKRYKNKLRIGRVYESKEQRFWVLVPAGETTTSLHFCVVVKPLVIIKISMRMY